VSGVADPLGSYMSTSVKQPKVFSDGKTLQAVDATKLVQAAVVVNEAGDQYNLG
jgi:hypothetical protein